ncbi:mucin-like glycoprotein [Trypanosoma cruzi]|uniref:Mucin-like glycoprotein, putative n=1 Tax=Trypanosoma cruzi (strain CL Brener) TaxID=353153 RepID=Q4DGK1_TRYCC|nr:mucin-like glycoprotein, putative [Trypanosoma cruzi]EAN91662.1 mucin-like glycoprotein, putative [Trypanosoma cruzi]RNC45353.1 mucin-like glycoprotein [Trypanosoma cruzi]|eukprot:XP_813513.1 mucin-like glycoprotein [Trypanosoma cruzi strain CL Brener]
MMMMVMVRRRAVCAMLFLALSCCCCSSVCVTAAGSAGHVSGDAGTVVVPVDVSCAQSDGSLSYRVHGGVWAWTNCSAAGAEAQHENYTFSGFDVRMHSRNGELGTVCHVANAVYTSNNCAASCATEGEGVTVAFTMNVTTHEYAGLYELWKNQFSSDGTIPAPARSSDADRTGICHPPPPREGKDERKSGEATASQVSAEPSRQNEDAQQSAVADAPRTVDQSPASNTSETNPKDTDDTEKHSLEEDGVSGEGKEAFVPPTEEGNSEHYADDVEKKTNTDDVGGKTSVHDADEADGSDIIAVWVHTPLLLLLLLLTALASATAC